MLQILMRERYNCFSWLVLTRCSRVSHSDLHGIALKLGLEAHDQKLKVSAARRANLVIVAEFDSILELQLVQHSLGLCGLGWPELGVCIARWRRGRFVMQFFFSGNCN